MLARLKVSNLAVVESAEAEFAPGLNVVTGETGAGKSVLMGAIGLAVGARADSSVVRDGAKDAKVEAEFLLDGDVRREVEAILSEAGIADDEAAAASGPRTFIIRRTIGANGSGRVWIDDVPSTVATLRKVGRQIVDIHGASANLRLMDEGFQRSALDAFGGVDASTYSKRWRALADIRSEIASLESDTGGEDEADALRYQVDELSSAELCEDDETVAERHAALAHAAEIAECAEEVTEALGGDGGVSETLSRIQPRFAAMARRISVAEDWVREAEELTVRAQELSRAVADEISRMDAGRDEMDRLDERLGVLNRLKRKYLKHDRPGAVAELIALLERKRARLEALEGREAKIAALRQAEAEALAAVEAEGAKLSAGRRAAARKLSKAVESELKDLGFLQAKFTVALERREPDASGCDGVSYVFEPNPGEGARPLADTASSGEAARVMLAVKGVLARRVATDVMVFDEIDANVGGEVGRAVGEKMRAVAEGRQVIAITHLPQSAAYAARHLVVAKAVSDGRTRTSVAAVNGEARITELARMLGGGAAASAARRHAEELISNAAAGLAAHGCGGETGKRRGYGKSQR